MKDYLPFQFCTQNELSVSNTSISSQGPRTNEQHDEEGATALSANKADDKDNQNHSGAAFTEKLKSRAKSVTLLGGAGHGNSGIFISFQYQKKKTNKNRAADNLAVKKCNKLLCFNILKKRRVSLGRPDRKWKMKRKQMTQMSQIMS